MRPSDIIIACSSGEVTSAISVIRICGDDILKDVAPFFSITTDKIKPRYAHFCKVIDDKQLVDEIVLTYFKAPHSYNGKDILELSVHGNPLNVRRIIDLFLTISRVRMAKPGEFSYIGLENKKLTLNQVEGLDLLLNANSIFALDQGFSLLSGNLQKIFLKLHADFLNHKSSIEMGFDFLEDIGEVQFIKNKTESFAELEKTIAELYQKVENNGFNLIRPEVVLAGQPNAGKSTLFNILLGEQRAIVSKTSGTTRDYLTEDISINKNIFTLIDTAGIRQTSDEIEQSGINRALELLERAFFKVLVVNPFEFSTEYYKQFKNFHFDLVLFTHGDLPDFEQKSASVLQEVGPIEPIDFGPIEADCFAPIEPGVFAVNLTADTAEINEMCRTFLSAKYLKLLSFDPILITRHQETIKQINKAFMQYKAIMLQENDLAVVSSELTIVGHCISELIGIVSADDVLHNIFDNFCIGK